MRYLALGDSYTIGELVAPELNFPHQVVDSLTKKNKQIELTQIIAKTGWTTDELNAAIAIAKPDFNHDWVSLLIGVNNQYRERSAEEYAWQFYALLCQSILFAKSNPSNVLVLSIPDWGLTPFNQTRDAQQVSLEIDELNKINKAISLENGCHYIDITELSRKHAKDNSYLASDLLHYSEHEYALWAEKIADIILK